MHACMPACMHACIHTQVCLPHACIYVCMKTYIYAYIDTCMLAHIVATWAHATIDKESMHMLVYTCMHTYMHICTRRICAHTDTIHTCSHVSFTLNPNSPSRDLGSLASHSARRSLGSAAGWQYRGRTCRV